MKANIDNIVNVAIARRKNKFDPIARVSENEPTFVITQRWFKKWKTIQRTYKSEYDAYNKYNSIMSELENLENITINRKYCKVVQRDTNPACSYCYNFVYDVNIYWRNAK